MFGRNLPIKILLRENARLRRELRRKEQSLNELLDNFVFHRTPERFINQQSANAGGGKLPATLVSDMPSDAYSAAIADAEREVDKQLRFHPVTNEPNEDADI